MIDTARRSVTARIPVGAKPNDVVLSADGGTAYVSVREDDAVRVVDLVKGEAAASLPAGFSPTGLALEPDGSRLFVANSLGDDISVIDPATGREQTRLASGVYPYGAAVSPDGGLILVGNRLAHPARSTDRPDGEVTVLDARTGRVASRIALPNAHLLEGIRFVPGEDLAVVTMVRPKNLIPALQVERGWMMTNGFTLIDARSGKAVQLPLDDIDQFYADPSDIAVTPDGRYLFVSHAGVDRVSVVDFQAVRRLVRETPENELPELANHLSVSSRYVIKRIVTGTNPRGLAVSPDGRYLYVAERLDDRIGVIDVDRLEMAGDIDLGGPRHETVVRRGEKVFNSATITLQNQFSCRSCHPDNHADRLAYDFEPDGLGRNIVDNRTLLGIDGTGPFKWNGHNTSLYMQCGVRFARFLTRSQPFSPEDLTALVAFISSLEAPRNRYRAADGSLTEAERHGREIFDRVAMKDGTPIPPINRCATCHPGPLYTDKQRHDVGSASPGDSDTAFDTPQMKDLAMTGPYLHDGKARSLEEIWTVYSLKDTHGVTSDLGKSDLNDLIQYLKGL